MVCWAELLCRATTFPTRELQKRGECYKPEMINSKCSGCFAHCFLEQSARCFCNTAQDDSQVWWVSTPDLPLPRPYSLQNWECRKENCCLFVGIIWTDFHRLGKELAAFALECFSDHPMWAFWFCPKWDPFWPSQKWSVTVSQLLCTGESTDVILASSARNRFLPWLAQKGSSPVTCSEPVKC